MKPHQIISLMTFEGTDNTFAMGDHADHIHVGFRPLYGANSKAARAGPGGAQAQAVDQADRPQLGEIDNPTVREQPVEVRRRVTKRASHGAPRRAGDAGRLNCGWVGRRVRTRSDGLQVVADRRV